MQVRIIVPVLEYGAVRWTKGKIAVIPDKLGQAFIDSKEAVLVPIAERATLPKPERAIVPRTFSKPTPKIPAKKAGR